MAEPLARDVIRKLVAQNQPLYTVRKPKAWNHGTETAVYKYKCECDVCDRWKDDYNRKRRLKRTGRSHSRITQAEGTVHGTRAGYQRERKLGLEICDECRYANTLAARELKARKAAEGA